MSLIGHWNRTAEKNKQTETNTVFMLWKCSTSPRVRRKLRALARYCPACVRNRRMGCVCDERVRAKRNIRTTSQYIRLEPRVKKGISIDGWSQSENDWHPFGVVSDFLDRFSVSPLSADPFKDYLIHDYHRRLSSSSSNRSVSLCISSISSLSFDRGGEPSIVSLRACHLFEWWTIFSFRRNG